MAKKVSKAQFKHAMSRRMVDISQTSWKEKSAGAKGQAGRLRGPGGKLYTGAVDLGGGKTATYEKGRRLKVTSSKKGFPGTPKTSNGAARNSTGGTVSEVTKNPAKVTTGRVDTSTLAGISAASGKTFKTGSPRKPTRVSSAYQGSNAWGAPAGTPRPKTVAGKVSKATSGFVRGSAASPTVRNRPKGQSYSSALQAKRRTDTRNQNRNAAVIASLPLLAVGGVKGVAAATVAARTGSVAAAGARAGIASLGRTGTPTMSPTAQRLAAASRAAARKPARRGPAQRDLLTESERKLLRAEKDASRLLGQGNKAAGNKRAAAAIAQRKKAAESARRAAAARRKAKRGK